MISVVILTLNEEVNLAECLSSIPWRTDVHVLDSGSTDATAAVALRHGASLHVRHFSDYADQRNAGLRLPFANPWVLMLDADERLTPDLAQEMETRIATVPDDTAMFRVRRRDMFDGRWLQRASGYPTWFPRLMRVGRVTVGRIVNEEYAVAGAIVDLNGHIDHYPFNKGIDWWFERHNLYSTLEAKTLLEESAGELLWRDLFCGDRAKRRSLLKQVFYRLPGRPFIAFFYLYVIRCGFIDGRAGFNYCLLRMAYEVMISTKMEASLRR